MAEYGAPIVSDIVKSKIDGVDYYTKTSSRLSTDGKTETTILYAPEQPIFGNANYIPAATTTDGGKTWNYAKYKQGGDIPSGKKVGDEIFGNQAKKSLEGGALKTNSNNAIDASMKKEGVSTAQQKQAALNQNTASPTGDPPVSGAAAAAKTSDANANKEDISNIGDAAGKYKGRTEYSGKTNALKYPLNMDTNQDCIKFTVIEYRPSKSGVGGSAGRPTVDTGNLISQIVLPMPSAIVDSNPVDWGAGRLDMGTQVFSDAIMGFLDSGTKGAEVGARKTIDEITKNKGLMEKIIKVKTLESALGTTNLLSRLEGLAFNPSLELLFGGPSLRNFSFSFKMNPRSEDEAKMVRSIIRTFKQTMSVKRSESTFILRAPHTFKISYLLGHSGKPHPYLNRFKECALTNCSVNYTPDGQYMSYSGAERSMTAYELQLQFQELEPIFDDDYDNDQDGASAKFENIGY